MKKQQKTDLHIKFVTIDELKTNRIFGFLPILTERYGGCAE